MTLSALARFGRWTKQLSKSVACTSFVPRAEPVWDELCWRVWSEQQPTSVSKLMRLETGNRQHPAMALYESYGFVRIPPFRDNVNDPTSVCYEKPVLTSVPK